MKSSFINKLIPQTLLDRFRRFGRLGIERRNRNKSAEEVFTQVYKKKAWGDSRQVFCSGTGSIREDIVSPYVSMIFEEAYTEGFRGLTFVDLGCGDFRIGEELLPLCSEYIGVDIVKPLIRRNQMKYENTTTRFLHLDIVKDELPDGDVCFLRQVLQHLSNQQISAILKKLNKYKWVYITEHHPSDNDVIRPNLDKIHGQHLRLYDNSGVYLADPPFELPPQKVRKVLEVPGAGLGAVDDQGIVRTFLYKP